MPRVPQQMNIMLGFHPFLIVSKSIRCLHRGYTHSGYCIDPLFYTNVAFAPMERHRGAWKNGQEVHSSFDPLPHQTPLHPCQTRSPLYRVSRTKNERVMGGQSRGSWGALFTRFLSLHVFDKWVTCTPVFGYCPKQIHEQFAEHCLGAKSDIRWLYCDFSRSWLPRRCRGLPAWATAHLKAAVQPHRTVNFFCSSCTQFVRFTKKNRPFSF